jgi:hypothetical protein
MSAGGTAASLAARGAFILFEVGTCSYCPVLATARMPFNILTRQRGIQNALEDVASTSICQALLRGS